MSWRRSGLNQGLDGRDRNGLVLSGACASSSRVSVKLYDSSDSTRSERVEGGLMISGSYERSDMNFSTSIDRIRRKERLVIGGGTGT